MERQASIQPTTFAGWISTDVDSKTPCCAGKALQPAENKAGAPSLTDLPTGATTATATLYFGK